MHRRTDTILRQVVRTNLYPRLDEEVSDMYERQASWK